jgi:hypothetical protein
MKCSETKTDHQSWTILRPILPVYGEQNKLTSVDQGIAQVLTWEEYRAETVFEPWNNLWPLQALSLRTRACPGRKIKDKREVRVVGGMCMRCLYWIYGQARWVVGSVYFPHGIATSSSCNCRVHKGCGLPQKHSTRDISFLTLQVFMAVTSQFTSSSRTDGMILCSFCEQYVTVSFFTAPWDKGTKIQWQGEYLAEENLRIKSQELMLSMRTTYKVHRRRNSHTWHMYWGRPGRGVRPEIAYWNSNIWD